MLNPRQRFPGRGSAAAYPRARQVPRAQPQTMVAGPGDSPGIGQFAGNPAPPQNLFGVALRELRTSLLDGATALRLADTSARPRYFGTDLASPQALQGPSSVNSPDSVDAGIVNAGNAPQLQNKVASGDRPPRIARSLPARPM